jgi:hypothetical protein
MKTDSSIPNGRLATLPWLGVLLGLQPLWGALGGIPQVNTVQGSSNFSLVLTQPGNQETIANFLINSNSANGFLLVITFGNKGKFKNGGSEIPIAHLWLDKVGGSLGGGLTEPVNEPISLDQNGSWTWNPGASPTTETVNYLTEVKATWTSQSNVLAGFYTESISATITVTL